jgi:hypothetical protein
MVFGTFGPDSLKAWQRSETPLGTRAHSFLSSALHGSHCLRLLCSPSFLPQSLSGSFQLPLITVAIVDAVVLPLLLLACLHVANSADSTTNNDLLMFRQRKSHWRETFYWASCCHTWGSTGGCLPAACYEASQPFIQGSQGPSEDSHNC